MNSLSSFPICAMPVCTIRLMMLTPQACYRRNGNQLHVLSYLRTTQHGGGHSAIAEVYWLPPEHRIGQRIPRIKKLFEYWDAKKAIPWKKVHDLPDFVRFNHERHIQRFYFQQGKPVQEVCGYCHGT
ncbi:MAG: hypothetical protein WDM70_11640 [Nitrosomonadales bacterium]